MFIFFLLLIVFLFLFLGLKNSDASKMMGSLVAFLMVFAVILFSKFLSTAQHTQEVVRFEQATTDNTLGSGFGVLAFIVVIFMLVLIAGVAKK